MHTDTIKIQVTPTLDNKFCLTITTHDDILLEKYDELTLENIDFVINTKSKYVQVIPPDLIGNKND